MEVASPLPNSYWALPGLLLAGEHPTGSTPDATRRRLSTLLATGIECFLDLTHPSEIDAYDEALPFHIEYLRKPIRDHGLPEKREHMMEILDCLHDVLGSGRPAYVHCRAGIGRTGMVVGCLLVERGLSGEEALDELARLWQQSERSKVWPSVPETDAQTDYIRRWAARKLRFPAGVSGRAPRTAAAPAAGPIAEPMAQPQARPPAQPLTRPPAGPSQAVPDPLLDPAALAAARSVRERFLGALLGLATGDAIAAPTQYRRPGTFTPVGDMIGGGPFALPRGGWSDDTAMALCLADSLLATNGFDARDQVARYRRWQRDGYLSATGQCLGITASTARALAMSQWRRQLFSGSHAPDQLDPEPLSRVAPVVMFFLAVEQEAVQLASDAARTTCQAPAVLAACHDLAAALFLALYGQPKSRILSDISAGSDIRESGKASRGDGSATGALAIALEAFAATDNFRDAVLHAANCGGNSDVAAAACGQLAGAFYGASAIPVPWRECLLHRDLIESYADRLLQHFLLKIG
jgi:ADP-ribosyl-[dinitrogen reductase] hydrolase